MFGLIYIVFNLAQRNMIMIEKVSNEVKVHKQAEAL